MANKLKDLTGQRFGKLVVLERDFSKKYSKPHWKCQCDCGNITIVRGSHLTASTKPTRSCGCLAKETAAQLCREKLIDLTGEKFGSLTVLNRVISDDKRTYWKCQCDCGKIITIRGDTLKQQYSCGCKNISKGEIIIKETLDLCNIKYITQKAFEDLKDEAPLRFDFFLPNENIAIEYQGIQHYEINDFFGGEEYFNILCIHDQLKRDYCKEHNIKLIEIPYWDYNKLNEDYLLLKINS